MSEYKEFIMNAFQVSVDTLQDVSLNDYSKEDSKYYFSFKTLRNKLDNLEEIANKAKNKDQVTGLIFGTMKMCKSLLAQSEKYSKTKEINILVSAVKDIAGNLSEALDDLKKE